MLKRRPGTGKRSSPSDRLPRRWRDAVEGYLFLLPNLVGFLIFFAVPVGMSLYYSFTDYDLFTTPNFVDIQNYRQILGLRFDSAAYQSVLAEGGSWFQALDKLIVPNDPTFWQALGNTVKYTGGVLLICVPLSILFAYLMNSRLPGMTVFRALFYIPVVASIVGVALVWLWIYHRQAGVLNYLITQGVNLLNSIVVPLGGQAIADPLIGWLVRPEWALLSLILMTSWATLGYDMVIFLAALQGIPGVLFEAARVDGASRTQTFFRVVLPLLSPTIFFVLVTNTIATLQIFAEPYIMTQGGPANSTLTIVYYLYQKGFRRFQMGYGSSLAWITFALIFTVTIVQFRLSRRWVHEEG